MTHPALADPSDNDVAITTTSIRLELTARDLYDAAIAALGSDADPLWAVLRDQHESYAQRLAGLIGVSASGRDDALFDATLAGFESDDRATTAADVENQLAARHVADIAQLTDLELAGALASFVAVESRHAVVLTTLAGDTDPASLFTNSYVGGGS